MGNPEFARYHLEKMLLAGFNVVAVVSAPDKPGGRGMKIQSTPVTSFAKSKKIPCLQPKNLKTQKVREYMMIENNAHTVEEDSTRIHLIDI